MTKKFKPIGYSSVSPYFVAKDAKRLIELLGGIFNAQILKKYNLPDGTIMHAEIKIDDSVIMLGNSSDKFPSNKLLTHIYVANVDEIFQRAIDLGCESVEEPKERGGDPDRRGSFKDFAGNVWSISTHIGGRS
ncbi:MAG: VOC family protein [Bacteroidia bacterium]|nr:VOC family protein [Bacteroidia bacterium]